MRKQVYVGVLQSDAGLTLIFKMLGTNKSNLSNKQHQQKCIWSNNRQRPERYVGKIESSKPLTP